MLISKRNGAVLSKYGQGEIFTLHVKYVSLFISLFIIILIQVEILTSKYYNDKTDDGMNCRKENNNNYIFLCDLQKLRMQIIFQR